MQAFGAQDKARGATLTREQLLEEFLAREKCVCSVDDQSYLLAKHMLRKNNFDGLVQAAVISSLGAGRVGHGGGAARRPRAWKGKRGKLWAVVPGG